MQTAATYKAFYSRVMKNDAITNNLTLFDTNTLSNDLNIPKVGSVAATGNKHGGRAKRVGRRDDDAGRLTEVVRIKSADVDNKTDLIDRLSQLVTRMRELMFYTYARVESFPKRQKHFVGLGRDITDLTMDCLILMRTIAAYNPHYDREKGLRELSVKLKVLEDLVGCGYQCRSVTKQSREAWLRMLTTMDNEVMSLAIWLEHYPNNRQRRQHEPTAS